MTCLPKMKHEDTIYGTNYTRSLSYSKNILRDRRKMRLCYELSSPCKPLCHAAVLVLCTLRTEKVQLDRTDVVPHPTRHIQRVEHTTIFKGPFHEKFRLHGMLLRPFCHAPQCQAHVIVFSIKNDLLCSNFRWLDGHRQHVLGHFLCWLGHAWSIIK